MASNRSSAKGSREELTSSNDESNLMKFWQVIKAFVKDFSESVSAHGFMYIAKSGLHYTERVVWFVFICIAFYAITSLSQRIWQRYQTNPMVISMDRNKYLWNTSFPSLTVCPKNKIEDTKMDEYIARNEKYFPDEQTRSKFKKFMIELANITFENMDNLPAENTFGIQSTQYLDLIYEMSTNFLPDITGSLYKFLKPQDTLTELGICYAFNSRVAKYSSYEYWNNNSWDYLEPPLKLFVHPLEGEVFGQLLNITTPYDFYYHSADDVPDITKHKSSFLETEYATVRMSVLEIYTTKAAKSFRPNQRNCKVPKESENMLASPIYSKGLCKIDCRMKMSLKYCGCIPHFYRRTARNGRILPVCDFSGLRCLAKIKEDLISLKIAGSDCKCYENCDDSYFFVQTMKTSEWFFGGILQWGIATYPKMQLRRDNIFSFADVLVYIGGLAGFFLGCSLLSLAEFFYYFTIRIVRRIMAALK